MFYTLALEYPMQLFQDDSDSPGQWLEVEQLTIRIPKNWDQDGKPTDYQIFGIGQQENEFRLSQAANHSIILDHLTYVHYSSSFSCFENFELPTSFNVKNYKYIYFKKVAEDNTVDYDIIGFNVQELDLEKQIRQLVSQLFYEQRHSEQGIRKQVEDSVEEVCYQSLKKLIRLIGRINNLQYETMYELTKKVLLGGFPVPLKEDIQSIVYKTLIHLGLFPFYLEINTMGDPILWVQLVKVVMGTEVLPWSPKFHASFVVGNYHYSFSDNSEVNQRTLKQRKFKKDFNKFQYIRLKILDFYPLDQWVELISEFFITNLSQIFNILRAAFPQTLSKKSSRFEKSNDRSSCHSISGLKEPLIMEIKEQNEQLEKSTDIINNTQPFKALLRSSIKSIANVREVYGIVIRSPLLVKIKQQIAQEFYQNYGNEVNRNGILSHFSTIITETEMRNYSYFTNNCQTPVAAFIYLLCDTFRPYSEMLYEKTTFLQQASIQGFNVKTFSEYHTNPQLSQECKQLPILLDIYCKYASSFDYQILSDLFIQPVVLEFSLDYFGFYSDRLQNDFVKSFQKIDFEPYEFSKHPKLAFKKNNFADAPDNEVNQFIKAYESSIEQVVKGYKTLQMPQKGNVAHYLKSKIRSEIFYDQSKFNIHYIMQHFQNQIIKIKQIGIKRPQYKHLIQDCQDFAHFIYFNSIRLQLLQKQRKNTLSLIGYVIAKDVEKIHQEEPENIELLIYQ